MKYFVKSLNSIYQSIDVAAPSVELRLRRFVDPQELTRKQDAVLGLWDLYYKISKTREQSLYRHVNFAMQ